MPRRTGMGVVVIMPAFTEGEECDPPVVTRIIVGREPAHAPHVSGRIYQHVVCRPNTTRTQMPHRTKGNPPTAYRRKASTSMGAQ